MGTAPIPAEAPGVGPLHSKRLLAMAGDKRLVDQIRRGNEAAFEVVFERHARGILSFCRHMLSSQEDAEDAVQHTFASAYRHLLLDERPINLKPWLYTIARNRCLSMLRARREAAGEQPEIATAGLDEQVERRADLRELLRDLHDLPEDQRAALVLTELGDLSHADVAGVLGCEVPKVKALVFRARAGLNQRREAREAPCQQVREELASLRRGGLRRNDLRHHLRSCPACRAFGDDVRRQRAMLGVVLPVTPTLGLKSSVLAAVGLGGGSAGAGAAAAGAAGAASLGSSTVAKIAAVAVIAAGGGAAGKAALDARDPGGARVAPPAHEAPAQARTGQDAASRGAAPRGEHRGATSAKRRDRPGTRRGRAKEQASGRRDNANRRALGGKRRSAKAPKAGRGRADATAPRRQRVKRRRSDAPGGAGNQVGSPRRGEDAPLPGAVPLPVEPRAKRGLEEQQGRYR